MNEAVRWDIVELAVATQAWKTVGEVDPRTDQDGAGWQRNALIP